jgi:uncharacterized protein involved in outer membrane biogenesis
MLPVGWLKENAEQALSKRVGAPVTIESIERENALSFTPVIHVSRIAIPQPKWAGPGMLATVQNLRVRVNVFAVLFGKATPQLLSASGVALNLVRDTDQRVNWRTGPQGTGTDGPDLADLQTIDGVVDYRDAFQQRAFRVSFRLDPDAGLSVNGEGEVAGNAVAVRAKGAAPQPGKWPFGLSLQGDALTLQIDGTMDEPFEVARMKFETKARANDLKLIDRLIEAGLFGTQPVDLTAQVEREGERWNISSLSGTIGSSDINGKATVVKSGTGATLDASIRSRQLDFEDLASDEGNASARALEQSLGLKAVPNTRVNIEKVALTKGRINVEVDRLVSKRRPSALTSLSGVLVLEGKLLEAKSVRIGLTKGTISGEMTVDQREGRPQPLVTMAFDLRGSSINALFGGSGTIDAPVDGRIRLKGTGDTLREAVGRADGTIGLATGTGSLPDKLATLMGFDVGRALFADDEERALLRCAVVRLNVKQGVGTASPLIVDTSRSQATGRGTVSFPSEKMAMLFTGAPKGNSVLRVPGSVTVAGTIRDPQVMVPREVRSLGNILKGVGRAITGKQGPKAQDANCNALRQLAVGR